MLTLSLSDVWYLVKPSPFRSGCVFGSRPSYVSKSNVRIKFPAKHRPHIASQILLSLDLFLDFHLKFCTTNFHITIQTILDTILFLKIHFYFRFLYLHKIYFTLGSTIQFYDKFPFNNLMRLLTNIIKLPNYALGFLFLELVSILGY